MIVSVLIIEAEFLIIEIVKKLAVKPLAADVPQLVVAGVPSSL